MTKRRRGFGGWISRLDTWKLILGFIGLALASGSAVLASLSGFERQYGIMASHFGWAPIRSVVAAEGRVLRRMDTIDLRLIYSEIRRLQREQERLRAVPSEKQRLEDVTTELADTIADYQAIKRRLKDGIP